MKHNIAFQSLGKRNPSERADLETRGVGKKGLRALRVVKWSVANTTPGSTDGEVATVEQVARSVAVLGCFVDYLEKVQKQFRFTQLQKNETAKTVPPPYNTVRLYCCILVYEVHYVTEKQTNIEAQRNLLLVLWQRPQKWTKDFRLHPWDSGIPLEALKPDILTSTSTVWFLLPSSLVFTPLNTGGLLILLLCFSEVSLDGAVLIESTEDVKESPLWSWH